MCIRDSYYPQLRQKFSSIIDAQMCAASLQFPSWAFKCQNRSHYRLLHHTFWLSLNWLGPYAGFEGKVLCKSITRTNCDKGYSELSICSVHSSDDDVEEKTGVNHTEATWMFEELLSYLERQNETSPAELLTMKWLCDQAATKWASKLTQKTMIDYCTNKQ